MNKMEVFVSCKTELFKGWLVLGSVSSETESRLYTLERMCAVLGGGQEGTSGASSKQNIVLPNA